MTHVILGIGAIAMIMIFGWALFFMWIVATVFRIVARTLGVVLRSLGILPARRKAPPKLTLLCHNFRCSAANPAEARFCRRCGSPMTASIGTGAPASAPNQPARRIVAYV